MIKKIVFGIDFGFVNTKNGMKYILRFTVLIISIITLLL